MASRQQRKAQTRRALMEAALQLVAEGAGVADLSIREIAKQAGVVPTAFYRHFKNVDELGLNIVDELGMTLRQLIRSARQEEASAGRMIRRSIRLYGRFLDQHQQLFRYMVQARTGPSPMIREAVRSELKYFVNELVVDLQRLQVLPHVAAEDLEMIADLVVNTVANASIDLLDSGEPDSVRRRALEERVVKQVRLIFLGAGAWRSGAPHDERPLQAGKTQAP